MEHRRLQHPPERERLLRLFLLTSRELLDLVVEIPVEIATQLREIGAARRQNPLAVLVVRQGIEQMLERQVRVSTGRRDTRRSGRFLTKDET